MIQNSYEMLGINYDADHDAIYKAYSEKILCCDSDIMREKYKTAYYKLIDDERRYEYDISLGIHRYRKLGFIRRGFKIVARIILTLIDAVMTFYWCFLWVLVVYTVGISYYQQHVIDVTSLLLRYSDEIYILFLFALMDLVLHFYVRRANRYLKHYKGEIKSYAEYSKIMGRRKNDTR